MNAERKKKLEAAGWKFGDYSDFLELSPEEKALVEIRLAATRNSTSFTTPKRSKQL